jgi:hypothetical protein
MTKNTVAHMPIDPGAAHQTFGGAAQIVQRPGR